MTHQEFDKRLGEILETALNDFYDYITEKDIIKVADEYSNKTIPKKAKQAIRELFLEVVEQASPAITFSKPEGIPNTLAIDFAERHLKQYEAKLRTAITGKEGGE